jgi:hypothetical protein
MPPAAAKNSFQSLARASWIAPLIGIAVNIMLVGSGNSSRHTSWFVAVVFLGGGLLAGVVALGGIFKYGRKGILVPALIGIAIPVALAVLALPNFYAAKRRARAHVPPQPAVHATAARILRDEKSRFSMDIPHGFEDWPEGAVAPNVLHCFARKLPGADDSRLVINVQRLNGTIPPNQPLRREDVLQHAPPGTKLDLIQKKWRGFKVDTFVSEVSLNGVQAIVYGVQIPLVPRAIQINVGGPVFHRSEVEKLADEILVSLEGNTNWEAK